MASPRTGKLSSASETDEVFWFIQLVQCPFSLCTSEEKMDIDQFGYETHRAAEGVGPYMGGKKQEGQALPPYSVFAASVCKI